MIWSVRIFLWSVTGGTGAVTVERSDLPIVCLLCCSCCSWGKAQLCCWDNPNHMYRNWRHLHIPRKMRACSKTGLTSAVWAWATRPWRTGLPMWWHLHLSSQFISLRLIWEKSPIRSATAAACLRLNTTLQWGRGEGAVQAPPTCKGCADSSSQKGFTKLGETTCMEELAQES